VAAASDGEVTREQLDRARKDLSYFAEMVGWPLTDWQAASLRLLTWMTVVLGARQCGKSRALAVLASWQAFRRPRQRILIVSSAEDSALEILADVRDICSHPALADSVFDEYKSRLTLANGSVIRSVPSTSRAIRGKRANLLILDEASLIDNDVLGAAAIPTTMAQAGAKIVVAGTAWMAQGLFYQWLQEGINGTNPGIAAFTWKLTDCPWVSAEVVEQARRALPGPQFRAEYLGIWLDGGDTLIPAEDIDACVAGYPLARDGHGMPAVAGLDWGRVRDFQAVAVAAVCQDYGQNGRTVVVVPWIERSQRAYPDQVAEVGAVARLWALAKVVSENNGVGAGPTGELPRALPSATRVEGVHPSNELKGKAFGRLGYMFASRQIVIAPGPLVAELKSLVGRPTPSGELRIGSRTQSQHDDMAFALAWAVYGLPENLAQVPLAEVPDGVTWVSTPAGVKIPVPLITLRPEAAYDVLYGGLWHCPVCRYPVPSRLETCTQQGCSGRNPDYRPSPLASAPARSTAPQVAAADGSDPESVPVANYANPHMRECLRCGHRFDGSLLDKCPHPRGPGAGISLPPHFARALAIGQRR
jgi:Terminase large subunit, T4likevirus-type, N-terminal